MLNLNRSTSYMNPDDLGSYGSSHKTKVGYTCTSSLGYNCTVYFTRNSATEKNKITVLVSDGTEHDSVYTIPLEEFVSKHQEDESLPLLDEDVYAMAKENAQKDTSINPDDYRIEDLDTACLCIANCLSIDESITVGVLIWFSTSSAEAKKDAFFAMLDMNNKYAQSRERDKNIRDNILLMQKFTNSL